MRVCLIYKCTKAGDRRCCIDCDKIPCPNRCQNHPDRCKCWADEEQLKQGQKKGSAKSEDVLALAQRGLSYKEIAAKMNIGICAVQYHLNKLGYYRQKRGAPDG